MNLLNNVTILRCLNAQTSGGFVTTTGIAVDTAGFEGVMFIAVGSSLLNKSAVYLGCKTAASTTATFKLANNHSTGVALTSGLYEKTLAYDVYRPLNRYVRPVVVGASSGHVRSITAILYGPRRPGSSALESTKCPHRYTVAGATT